MPKASRPSTLQTCLRKSMNITRGLLLSTLVGTVAAATPGTDNQTGPLRPQMSAAQAAEHTAAHYLADGPTPWAPAAVDTKALKPDFIVAADGSGTHRTVQAAVDAVPAAAASNNARRWVIQIRPGTYREPLCVQGKAPLTLIGVPDDAGAVRLVEGRYNAQIKPAGTAAHACWPDLAATTYGTYGSASVVFASDDLTAAHLTIVNDAMDGVKAGQGYPPGAGESGGAQAVALMTIGDRVLLERVQLLAHQDTLHVRRAKPTLPGRVLVRASLIAGDVDFIFGNATLVIDDSTVLQRAGRRQPPNGGHVLAPSTPAAARLGFLVQRTRFTAEPGVAPGSISLGRAWDEGVARGTWQPGVSPNGQVLIRDSQLGPHLGGWSASTSRRPFAATGEQANRFFEFNNRPLPADPAREVLPADGGWAAAEGGTRGGAEAALEDVHTVRNRAQLLAALKPHPGADGRPGVQRPRLVKIAGRIDLAQAEDGRTLGFDDFRDPAFSWAAFEAAYAPATWGKRKPEGPLEEARQRSAKRQAAQVMLAVPSNTTLVGLGAGAEIVNGGLVLDGVQQVILRHLHLRRAYDHFPAWDANDNASGEWNSAYDTLMLRNTRHVWVDHCRFDDGEPETAPERVIFGRPLQRFDGLLDIIRGSQFVTVSHSHFRGHDKTVLIGNSDSLTSDDGKLQVTLHHNLWEDVKERAPRVRWGQVHLLNNLYLVNPGSDFGYSLGLGQGSRVFSESNAWQTPAAVPPTQLVRVLKGSLFRDSGSLHNGRPLDLAAVLRQAGASLADALGWVPQHPPAADPAEAVPARVRAAAGPGWLWLGAP
jgi:pectin methylesterase-like acyl-CoA thioesterase/pectate lyase